MIIHSPIISGSLTFASGSTFTLPANGQYTGSFSGSVAGIGDTAEFSSSVDSRISSSLFSCFASTITINGSTVSLGGSLSQAQTIFGAFSGSSQVNLTQTTNYVSGIKDRLNAENVISGSSQVLGGTGIVSSSAQIDSLFNIDGLVSSSAQVKDLLPAGTISGSSQVVNLTNGQLQNSSITIAGTSTSLGGSITLATITGNSAIVSGSSQVIAFLPSGVVSGSSQLTTEFDTRYLNTNGDSVVSGSSQVDGTQITNNSITISGTSTSLGGSITLATITGNSGIVSGSSQLTTDFDSRYLNTNGDGVVSGSAQIVGILSELNTYTSSNDTKWSTLGALSGSFARTNTANIFNGNQTITGSLYVSGDFVLQGSSSIQNISSSVLNVGTNLVTVNTNSPSLRFGGLSVIDSGSSGGSGSILYDSVQDEWVFVHKGNGTNVTSSHFVCGPETIDNLGNETYLTANRVPKSKGNEHIIDSNITDDGTTITLGSNTVISGTVRATGTALVSGSAQISGTGITNNTITIAGTSTALGGSITAATILQGTGVVSGSSQITLASTTGFGTYIDQALLTTSTVQFGKVGVGGASDATYELKVTGDIGATGDIVAYISSDERLKNNIELIENPIEKVKQLKGVTWEWNDLASDAAKQSPNIGVIAQDVEKVLPMLVFDRENGYKGVDYSKLVGLLIEVVKEQQQQIEDLYTKIK